MAVFDTGIGAVALYQHIPDFMDYYIDNLYHPYGMYQLSTLTERVNLLYEKYLKKEETVWVSSFDAAYLLREKENVRYGRASLNIQLKGKKVLSLGSVFHCHYSLLDILSAEVTKISVPVLINACGDLLSDALIRQIIREYLEEMELDYEIIFLADSHLHLKKSLIQQCVGEIPVMSSVDMLLLDYCSGREKKRRSNFYTTGYRRAFYLPAEAYLNVERPLYVWRLQEESGKNTLTFGRKRKGN